MHVLFLRIVEAFNSRHCVPQKLPLDELRQGLIIASSGNAAIALTMAAANIGAKRAMKIPVVAVVPLDTSTMKTRMLRQHGAELIQHGDKLCDAVDQAEAIAAQRGLLLLPQSHESHLIAGHGTAALEILRQHRTHIDVIFVPVASGRLLAGIAVYAARISPLTKVVGVEPLPRHTHTCYRTSGANKSYLTSSMCVHS